jgi:hypothetical protein
MFSSYVKSEENYQVQADWVVGLPMVKDFFGHQEIPTRIIVNEKGSTDSRVLNEVLSQYAAILYPDVEDEDGYRACFKIDGGLRRFNIPMLANLQCQGVYSFPGVQNTTHVTQETDQNYGLFKSHL